MVHLGAMLTEHLIEPLELFSGHPGRDLPLVALALLEHIHRDEQGIPVKPVEGGALHVVGAIKGHAQMTPKSILVKRHGSGHRTPPRVIGNLVITEGGIDLEIVILETLQPAGIIFLGPLINSLLLRSPVTHDQVTGHHGKSWIFLFHGTDDEPQCILPPFLGILDVKIEEVGNADKAPDLRILFGHVRGLLPCLQPLRPGKHCHQEDNQNSERCFHDVGAVILRNRLPDIVGD